MTAPQLRVPAPPPFFRRSTQIPMPTGPAPMEDRSPRTMICIHHSRWSRGGPRQVILLALDVTHIGDLANFMEQQGDESFALPELNRTGPPTHTDISVPELGEIYHEIHWPSIRCLQPASQFFCTQVPARGGTFYCGRSVPSEEALTFVQRQADLAQQAGHERGHEYWAEIATTFVSAQYDLSLIHI